MKDFQKKTIAILTAVCSINEESETVTGICHAAKKLGWNTLTFNAQFNYLKGTEPELDPNVFKLLNYDSVAGVIITQNLMLDNMPGKRLIEECLAHGLPIISAGYQTTLCNSVVYENSDCQEQIVDHVIEKHNCQTLNLVAGIKGNEFSEKRVKAFKRSLQKHNLKFEKERIFYGEFWEGPTIDGLNKFFETGLALPDAFICCNDVMAITVCDELTKRGYCIPEDVIVTGYDGVEFEEYSNPRLTTAKCDYEELGEKALLSLVDIIEGRKQPKLQKIPPKVIFSQSCGCQELYIQGRKNMCITAMKNISGLRHTTSQIHKIATMSSYAKTVSDLKPLLNANGLHNANLWILLNHHYAALGNFRKFTEECPFSETMDCFYSLLWYKEEEYKSIKRTEEYIPAMEHALQNGVTNMVIMDLFFGGESIGYIVVSYDDTDLPFMSQERFCQSMSQAFATVKSRNQLEYMTVRDMLTGIYNRRGFFTEITNQVEDVESSENKNRKLIIFSIDMDELKYINDTFGHKEGDFAIKKMAEAIKLAGGSEAICSRFGGDEFVSAIITRGNAEKTILGFKERLENSLSEINEKAKKPYRICASIGAKSTTISSRTKIEKLIAKADEMMYSDKTTKKRSHPRI